MVTAYSYPSAVHVDAAEIDVLLVGDSVGMVELGYDTTLPVTVDEVSCSGQRNQRRAWKDERDVRESSLGGLAYVCAATVACR